MSIISAWSRACPPCEAPAFSRCSEPGEERDRRDARRGHADRGTQTVGQHSVIRFEDTGSVSGGDGPAVRAVSSPPSRGQGHGAGAGHLQVQVESTTERSGRRRPRRERVHDSDSAESCARTRLDRWHGGTRDRNSTRILVWTTTGSSWSRHEYLRLGITGGRGSRFRRGLRRWSCGPTPADQRHQHDGTNGFVTAAGSQAAPPGAGGGVLTGYGNRQLLSKQSRWVAYDY